MHRGAELPAGREEEQSGAVPIRYRPAFISIRTDRTVGAVRFPSGWPPGPVFLEPVAPPPRAGPDRSILPGPVVLLNAAAPGCRPVQSRARSPRVMPHRMRSSHSERRGLSVQASSSEAHHLPASARSAFA